MNTPLHIQLGRVGDIINVLPVLHDQWKKEHRPQHLLVAQTYLPLLEGCSYIHPVVWPGDFADLKGAMAHAKKLGYRTLRVSQVYGHNCNFIHYTDSFIKESWHRLDRLRDWNKLPLVFDRRNPLREKELEQRFMSKTSSATLLVAYSGHSSPFPHKQALIDLLKQELSDFHIVDLSKILATRFYDLLGLFDKAQYLITIDTAHMHLAPASKIPVIALHTSGPTPWHSSAELRNQILRISYNDFPARQMEIVSVIKGRHVPRTVPPIPTATHSTPRNGSSLPRIFHLYNSYQRKHDAQLRHRFARDTWLTEYRTCESAIWVESPVKMEALSRTSTSVGDNRPLPFIKDLVKALLASQAIGNNDLICLTNDDIAFCKGLGSMALGCLETGSSGAAWSNRWDFTSLKFPLTTTQCRTGTWCCGTDTFFFTRRWWEQHSAKFPDMILACEAWDWIMRDLIRDTGGYEIHAMTYHQYHHSVWQSGKNRWMNPGNKHNQKLAKVWLQQRNRPLRELAQV